MSLGINLISTKTIPSFLIENKKEFPIPIRCNPTENDNSECEIDESVILKDNEYYTIHYSCNIYNMSKDIDETPITEFQYVNTNLLDELYYKIIDFDFEKGIINLNLSETLKKGEKINGVVGPDCDNVPISYQFNFVCEGSDSNNVKCEINRDNRYKQKYNGKYKIYYLEDYSLNEFELTRELEPEENYYDFIVDTKKKSHVLLYLIIGLIVLCCVVLYCFIKNWKKSEGYNKVRIAENRYLSDDYLYSH